MKSRSSHLNIVLQSAIQYGILSTAADSIEVKLTVQAIGQIEETVRYISKNLLEPETARKWADTPQREIEKLDSMPSRYPLTEEEPWHTKGIRGNLRAQGSDRCLVRHAVR